ncbi:T9SS type A sorting domain-containing protein [Marinilabilia salmonicolor]|uniref:Putative secreted protein (Por secretion system target) n=1 Tax=Marinilabilia salmonicolor TaxID=989 RepID=A0A368URS0_9BACT|nr:T9SS type A sorting domain-containing protein [Marinilabilia salmonicolor]RCW30835.1 putative secreted protein (Por secretion system target) [Marinilabilia salmonicolor]
MKLFYYTLIGLIFASSLNANAQPGWDYETKSDANGDFEQIDSWVNGNAPSADGIIDRKIIINGDITRNGDLTPVTVLVNGDFTVNGNYFNNEWEGLLIKSGAKVEIYGNLEASAAVTIDQGGMLIVHGNLTSSNAGLHIKGDLIVTGDFSTDSKTQVNNSGNLIVGGNFYHLGGGLNVKTDDIYILDPDAEVISNGSKVLDKGEYGTIEEFVDDEGDSYLGEIAEVVGLVAYEWTGSVDSDWNNKNNWKGTEVPESVATVKIDVSDNAPVIQSNLTISRLILTSGASVTVNPGASLDILKDVNNNGTIVLSSTNTDISALMLPEKPTKSGNVNVKLELDANEKFYLSSPFQNTELKSFYPDGDSENDFVYVFRKEPNWRWVRVLDSYLSDNGGVNTTEAVATMYKKGKQLNFGGEIINEDVTKVSEGKGFFLFGNPYPTAIDWEDPVGWDRDDFDNTMWSYITIKGERIVQTYNNAGDFLQGEPVIIPEGYDKSTASHIAPYQSVWLMQRTTGQKSITVKREARVKDSPVPLKSASKEDFPSDIIRIQTDNDILIDGTIIYFNELFSEFLGNEDSPKQFNSSSKVPEVYTRINNSAYAINGFPKLTETTYSIVLSVRNKVADEVTMSFDLDKFAAGYHVYLEDKETGSWTNIQQVQKYVYTPAQLGDDHDRFVLHFEQMQEVATSVEENRMFIDEEIVIIGKDDLVMVNIDANLLRNGTASIEVLNMGGVIENRIHTSSTDSEISLPAQRGLYIVKVKVGDVVKTAKIVK